MDLVLVPLFSSWTLVLGLGPIVYGLGPSDLVWTSSVASNCDFGPLDYDLGCIGYRLVSVG